MQYLGRRYTKNCSFSEFKFIGCHIFYLATPLEHLFWLLMRSCDLLKDLKEP